MYAAVFHLVGRPADLFISPHPPYVGEDRAAVEGSVKGAKHFELTVLGIIATNEVIEIADDQACVEGANVPYPARTFDPLFIRGPIFDELMAAAPTCDEDY